MKKFDGREEAQKLDLKIKEYVDKKPNIGELLIIQVGNNSESEKYVSLKMKLCEKVGIKVQYIKIGQDNTDENIVKEIKGLFGDEKYTGGIIQLPLPRPSLNVVLNVIPFHKDIDLLSPNNRSRPGFDPDSSPSSPVVRAVQHFLNFTETNIEDKKVIVIGGGFLVGVVLADYLKIAGAMVRIIDNYKRGDFLDSDLVILSAGIPGMVDPGDIKPGASVIDFGSSIVNGKTVGDLDTDGNTAHLGTISFSPGGMGPLVVRYLLMNFLRI